MRLLVTGGLPDPHAPGETFRSVSGGFLVQSRDTAHLTAADLKVVTKRAPTDEEVRDMLFAFIIAAKVVERHRLRPAGSDAGRRGARPG